MTDEERLDFLERVGPVSFGVEGTGFKLFTIPSQHVKAATVREAVDVAMEYESGERCWYCENWSWHKHGEDDWHSVIK